MEKDRQPMQRDLLVALAWLPLTDTACIVLSPMVLENQRSAAFSVGKLSELFQRRNKYKQIYLNSHICLVEFGDEVCMVFNKPCMVSTCFVQRGTNLQFETWPGSEASGMMRRRDKAIERLWRTKMIRRIRRIRRQQSVTYFCFEGSQCQSCDSMKLALI